MPYETLLRPGATRVANPDRPRRVTTPKPHPKPSIRTAISRMDAAIVPTYALIPSLTH
jgi:hypothetical protein